MSSQPNKLSFTGHETFPFRYTWLAKGVRGIIDDAELFGREDALVILGVGKNMVRSIRHWCKTLDLIEREIPNSWKMKVTKLGEKLFGVDGWDPFLENPGTPWLLHWLLVRRRDRASAWHLLFTQYSSNQFTRDQLLRWLVDQAEQAETRATEASIKRDVQVLIRTYVPAKASRDIPAEETFDSPLVQLGLINEIETGMYTFAIGPKPTLPDDIFLYALLEFWEDQSSGTKSLAFERILYGPGSPGAAFKLSSNALSELLDHLTQNSLIQLDETAGMRTIFLESEITPDTRMEVLDHFYSKVTSEGALV